jgi:hypothetical protein
MMDKLIDSRDYVLGTETNRITQFTFEMDRFLLEWPAINYPKQEIAHGFKSLTQYKAVADKDLRNSQSIIRFQATTEPPFRNIK